MRNINVTRRASSAKGNALPKPQGRKGKPAAKAETVKAPAKVAKVTKAELLAKARKAAAAPAAPAKPLGQRKAAEASAAAGHLPAMPDFSNETHKSWRNHITAIAALIEARDLAALDDIVSGDWGMAGGANPLPFWRASSTRAQIHTWVRLTAMAMRATKVKPAKPAGARARFEAALAKARKDHKADRLERAATEARKAAKAAPVKAAKAAPVKGKGKASAPAMATKAARPVAKAAPRKPGRK